MLTKDGCNFQSISPAETGVEQVDAGLEIAKVEAVQ